MVGHGQVLPNVTLTTSVVDSAEVRLGKTIDEIPGGHLVALSHPGELAELLFAYVAK
jgi:hypothetical protein